MRRILMLAILLLSLSVVTAQDNPAVTEEPNVVPVDSSATVTDPVEETTTEESAPSAQPPSLFGDALSELISLRNDLELLATAVQGTVRPDGWSGNLDVTNPQLPLLIRLDMELLLADTLGFDAPAGWFGTAFSEAVYQARDMRHDIELLADALLGDGQRPDGWDGMTNPLWACDRSTQTLVNMLAQGDFYVAIADPADPNYCQILELLVVDYVQKNLFTIDTTESYFTAAVRTTLPGSVAVNTDFAVGFFDISATQRAAVIPNGTVITPIGRNAANEFSRMVLFEGDGFLLFAEYTFTSLTEEEFETLPAAPAVQTTCTADWC